MNKQSCHMSTEQQHGHPKKHSEVDRPWPFGRVMYLCKLGTKRDMLRRHAVEDECPYCGRKTPMFNLSSPDRAWKYAKSCLWCGKRIEMKRIDEKWSITFGELRGLYLVEPRPWKPTQFELRMRFMEERSKGMIDNGINT